MAEHWDYLRVYVGDFAEIPLVLDEVVRPWLSAQGSEIARWYFIQYFDATGVHVRLRIQPRDPWSELSRQLEDELWDWCAARSVADAACLRFVLRRHYAPEYAKFGGALGLELAHRIARRRTP
jgi:thiopeptide-type bacteriocin biosynthesis protein